MKDIMEQLKNFEEVRDKIYIRLYPKDKAPDECCGIGYEIFMAVCYLELDEMKADPINEKILQLCDMKNLGIINEKLLDLWGMDREQVFNIARENMFRDYSCIPMETVLEGISNEMGLPAPDLNTGADAPSMEVLQAGWFGAGVLAVPEILKAVMPEGEYFIIPSSIYEVLIIPAAGFDVEEIDEMINSVNEKEVAPEDQLYDKAFYYKDGTLYERKDTENACAVQ